jgi:hydroxymethylpyrimidine pyrophosphatase-like HAD family hydrolase
VRINSQQTLLFAHNIDLAERLPLKIGDTVSFNGEYVYNPKGGIVHWTHLDPQGMHTTGWVMLQGKKYQ